MTGPPEDSGAGSWFGDFGQISFAVTDIRTAARAWRMRLGIGPWLLLYNIPFKGRYEGAPIDMTIDVALAWHDGRIVELVRGNGDGPSPFHGADNKPLLGLHRVAAVTKDMDRDAADAIARGMEQFVEVALGEQRFLFFRDPALPGVIFELLEWSEESETMTAQLEARARNFRSRRSDAALGQ